MCVCAFLTLYHTHSIIDTHTLSLSVRVWVLDDAVNSADLGGKQTGETCQRGETWQDTACTTGLGCHCSRKERGRRCSPSMTPKKPGESKTKPNSTVSKDCEIPWGFNVRSCTMDARQERKRAGTCEHSSASGWKWPPTNSQYCWLWMEQSPASDVQQGRALMVQVHVGSVSEPSGRCAQSVIWIKKKHTHKQRAAEGIKERESVCVCVSE